MYVYARITRNNLGALFVPPARSETHHPGEKFRLHGACAICTHAIVTLLLEALQVALVAKLTVLKAIATVLLISTLTMVHIEWHQATLTIFVLGHMRLVYTFPKVE